MAPSVREKRAKDKIKQASGSDSMGLQCRSQQDRVPGLVQGCLRTANTDYPSRLTLDDFDPQCHLIRTPTPD